MHIRSDRRYRFAAERAELWAAIAGVDQYRSWWPWLREFDGQELCAGAVWACQVQPPLPYTLRFRIRLQEVEEGEHVEATIDGDIVGTARLDLVDLTRGCEARLTSHLWPANRALQKVAVVARPVVRRGHDWVLDTGLRQFRARALP